MNGGNTAESYQFPSSKQEFDKAKKVIERLNQLETTVLINKARNKTRISSKVADIGADSIKILGNKLDSWVNQNINSSIIEVKRTGTGLIIDKNSVYVTESLIKGLGLALIIISIVMALMLRNWKMLILAFIPNILPVLFAGALLGYFGVELEAGISIVFAVIFGIAVDDTIHFLSKYKLCRDQNFSVEKSIELTFKETGKAILFTTIILFFGFMIMLFSSNPPTQTVGVLISVTLFAALLSDVLLLPVLMRKWLKD
jgi:predicted RND superfamily exporter protein